MMHVYRAHKATADLMRDRPAPAKKHEEYFLLLVEKSEYDMLAEMYAVLLKAYTKLQNESSIQGGSTNGN